MTLNEERELLDKAFIEEYIVLCKKHKRKFVVYIDSFLVDDLDDYIGVMYTRADTERFYQAELKRQEETNKKLEEEHNKRLQDYLDNGGKLDENGNIPISPNYCQLILWK